MANKAMIMGYHNIGCRGLKVLLAQGVQVVAVFSHQDDPKETCWFDSLPELAKSYKIPVYFPEDPNTPETIALIKKLEPDVIFSFYYRKMLSQEILEIPRYGAVNAHGSVLPKFRGRSPVNWQLVYGETEGGITLHYMVRKADAGDIVGQAKIVIGPDDTALDVFNKLDPAFEKLLSQHLQGIMTGTAPRLPQDVTKGNYCGGRKPDDGKIIWDKSAKQIHDLVRAVTTPYPGAFCMLQGKKIMVWKTKWQKDEASWNDMAVGTVFVHQGLWLVKAGSGVVQLLEISEEATGHGQPPHVKPELLLKAKEVLK